MPTLFTCATSRVARAERGLVEEARDVGVDLRR